MQGFFYSKLFLKANTVLNSDILTIIWNYLIPVLFIKLDRFRLPFAGLEHAHSDNPTHVPTAQVPVRICVAMPPFRLSGKTYMRFTSIATGACSFIAPQPTAISLSYTTTTCLSLAIVLNCA
jgi:hypothetical protein